MLKNLRTTPPAKGHDRVLYPGLPEAESEVERGQKGVPFHSEVIDWFKDICGELSLPYDLS